MGIGCSCARFSPGLASITQPQGQQCNCTYQHHLDTPQSIGQMIHVESQNKACIHVELMSIAAQASKFHIAPVVLFGPTDEEVVQWASVAHVPDSLPVLRR